MATKKKKYKENNFPPHSIQLIVPMLILLHVRIYFVVLLPFFCSCIWPLLPIVLSLNGWGRTEKKPLDYV